MPIFGLIRPHMPNNPALYRFVLFVCPELGVWRKTGGKGMKTLGFISSEGFWASTSTNKANTVFCQLCPKTYSYIYNEEGVKGVAWLSLIQNFRPETVWSALSDWILYKKAARTSHLKELAAHIQWPLMGADFRSQQVDFEIAHNSLTLKLLLARW